MKIVEKAFEGFNSVNRMGMQMMKNMMGRIDQASPLKGFENISFQDVPGLKKAQEGMKTLSEKAAEYAKLQQSAEAAAERGYVDTVISAEDTRKMVIGAFEMLYTKSEDRPDKKHGTV